jgi:hypothetical protein
LDRFPAAARVAAARVPDGAEEADVKRLWRVLWGMLWVSTAALALEARAQAPLQADAGPGVDVECVDAEATPVTLRGSASGGVGEILFTWTSPSLAGPVEGEELSVELPLGEHSFLLTVRDGAGSEDTDEAVVMIFDNEPPEIELGGAPVTLWPPNHKYQRVAIARFVRSVSDTCDSEMLPEDVTIDEVTSDEPENGRGDGNTRDDMVLVDDCRAVELRAERSGGGNGRVYEARVVILDGSGNASEQTIAIAKVPKSPPKGAFDDGDAFVVGGPCEGALDLCPFEPASDCFGADRSRIRLQRSRGTDRKNRLEWQLDGIDSDPEDFGDPTEDTDYQLCLYEERDVGTQLISSPGAPAGRSWRRRGESFQFRLGRDARSQGLDEVRLRAGNRGRGAIAARGRGEALELPELPLPGDADLTVQLHSSDGACWTATFSDPRSNSRTRYSARSD